MISPGGVVSSASYAAEAPLAPGLLIAIFGSHLADGSIAAQALPLPNRLGQTQVIIGGQPMPLIFVSDSQINAMLPYDVGVNRQQQVVVQRGTSYTTPETITLAAAGPAVFTKDQSGIGPGLVFDARFRSIDTGFTGLYQVNVVVPDGVGAGDAVPIVITVADRPGPPVTFAVR